MAETPFFKKTDYQIPIDPPNAGSSYLKKIRENGQFRQCTQVVHGAEKGYVAKRKGSYAR